MWCVLLASPPARRGGSVAHVAQRARRARLWGCAVGRGAAGRCGSRAVRSGAARWAKQLLSRLASARASLAPRGRTLRVAVVSGLLGSSWDAASAPVRDIGAAQPNFAPAPAFAAVKFQLAAARTSSSETAPPRVHRSPELVFGCLRRLASCGFDISRRQLLTPSAGTQLLGCSPHSHRNVRYDENCCHRIASRLRERACTAADTHCCA